MRKATLVMVLVWVGYLLGLAESIQNVSSKEAYEMVKQPNTYLIDVRSVAEYVFVGHPVMAYNIPLLFWKEDQASMERNSKFMEDLLQRFNTTDRLIFLCRSGARSAKAALMAQTSGFNAVFNVEKGFEGEKDSDGYRTVNGWKNNGLPYTYSVEKELSYTKRN